MRTATLPRVVFALLVAATFGAFFLAQRLKNEPTLVQSFVRTVAVFSPNGDGRNDRVRIAFRLKETDRVDVDVVNADGETVRTLADDRRLEAYRRLVPGLVWDGRDDDGRLVPDGTYRIRIVLLGQGRSIIVDQQSSSFVKDTRPPRVLVTSVGPQQTPTPTAELLPNPDGAPATINWRTSGRRPRVSIVRTGPGRPTAVRDSGFLKDGTTSWDWDGRDDDGATAPEGTYVAVVQARDRAGNVGTSVPRGDDGLPYAGFGSRLPGRGGISVRRLGVQPPSGPVLAGDRTRVDIDARGARWTATLRRLGSTRITGRYRGTRAGLAFRAPEGRSGVQLLTVRARGRTQTVPLLVQAREHERILVVVPWMTWQGRNPVDDDGDGLANLLERGARARLGRVFTGDGLLAEINEVEGPALAALDAKRRRYDLTSDLALAGADAPDLTGYRGILLVGDERWITPALGRRLRAFARDGGTVASLGTRSLRSQADLVGRRAQLVRPTTLSDTDLFGAQIGPVLRQTTTLSIIEEDALGLFRGGTGEFADVRGAEVTAGLTGGARQIAAAVTPAGRPVIVAARFGRGLVIRTGIAGFAQRLQDDPDSEALMGRTWSLLSR